MNVLRRLIPLLVLLALGGGAVLLLNRKAEVKSPPATAIEDPLVAKAVDAARKEVIDQPDDGKLWGRLGQNYMANGLADPARECFIEASRLAPDEARWPYLEGVSLLQRDPQAALACWQRAAECPGREDLNETARLRWAESLFLNDRVDEAEAAFRRVLERQPQNLRARLGLGLLAGRRHADDEAANHLRACTEHPSSRQKALSALASIARRKGDAALAGEYSRRADALPPDQSWPDPFFEELVPFTVGQQSLFIQAEQQIQQGNGRQAILLLQQLIREFPGEGRAYVKLGMILAESGDYAAAEEVLRNGDRAVPGLVQIHYFLAVSLFHQSEKLGQSSDKGKEKLNDSVKEADRAIVLKEDHGFAHLYRGLALRSLGRPAEGLRALREAVRCNPDSADPHLHLGDALWMDEKSPEGIRELEAAVRLSGPNDRRALKKLELMREKPTK